MRDPSFHQCKSGFIEGMHSYTAFRVSAQKILQTATYYVKRSVAVGIGLTGISTETSGGEPRSHDIQRDTIENHHPNPALCAVLRGTLPLRKSSLEPRLALLIERSLLEVIDLTLELRLRNALISSIYSQPGADEFDLNLNDLLNDCVLSDIQAILSDPDFGQRGFLISCDDSRTSVDKPTASSIRGTKPKLEDLTPDEMSDRICNDLAGLLSNSVSETELSSQAWERSWRTKVQRWNEANTLARLIWSDMKTSKTLSAAIMSGTTNDPRWQVCQVHESELRCRPVKVAMLDDRSIVAQFLRASRPPVEHCGCNSSKRHKESAHTAEEDWNLAWARLLDNRLESIENSIYSQYCNEQSPKDDKQNVPTT